MGAEGAAPPSSLLCCCCRFCCCIARLRSFLQRSLHVFTSSQHFSYTLRQVNGRWHASHIFDGRLDLAMPRGMLFFCVCGGGAGRADAARGAAPCVSRVVGGRSGRRFLRYERRKTSIQWAM